MSEAHLVKAPYQLCWEEKDKGQKELRGTEKKRRQETEQADRTRELALSRVKPETI
jgi:hypothetical protein